MTRYGRIPTYRMKVTKSGTYKLYQEFLDFLESQNPGEKIFSSRNDDDSINIPGVIISIL